MSIIKILKEDWSDYESRKIAKHKNLIDCRVPWETNYLINKNDVKIWLKTKMTN